MGAISLSLLFISFFRCEMGWLLLCQSIFPKDSLHDTLCSLTIAVRIAGLCHALVFIRICQQAFRLAIHTVLIRTDQLHGTSLHGLGALSRIPQHEHGLTKCRSLLLDSTRVSQDKRRFVHEISKWLVIERLYEVYALKSTQFLIDDLAHLWVLMHREYRLYIWELLYKASKRLIDMAHRLAEIFTPMCGNQYDTMFIEIYALKQRILSGRGHLCNEDCGRALAQLRATGVKNAVLGHLSKENNFPPLAVATVQGVLEEAGITDVSLALARRDEPTGVFEV